MGPSSSGQSVLCRPLALHSLLAVLTPTLQFCSCLPFCVCLWLPDFLEPVSFSTLVFIFTVWGCAADAADSELTSSIGASTHLTDSVSTQVSGRPEAPKNECLRNDNKEGEEGCWKIAQLSVRPWPH